VWYAHLSTHPGLTLCSPALRVSARKSGVRGGEWKVRSMQISMPSPVGAMHFSVPISAQKLCENLQKCAISSVEDCPKSS
jgi:hypothetical protein